MHPEGGGGSGAVPGWEGAAAGEWARRLGVPDLELHPALGSTNDRLRECGRDGAAAFTTVVAGSQTAGRGREGRGWRSEPGAGLWISVLLPLPPGGAPGVAPLAVGVAVAQALEVLGLHAVGLKWPNDVVVGGGKLAGILCEVAHGGAGRPSGIVAGIGINLESPGPLAADGGLPPTWFAQEHPGGRAPGVAEVARVLLRELRRWADPPPARLTGALADEWGARDALLGRRVRVEAGGGGTLRGWSTGVAADGALLLRTDPDPAGSTEGRVLEIRAGRIRLDSLPGVEDAPAGTRAEEA